MSLSAEIREASLPNKEKTMAMLARFRLDGWADQVEKMENALIKIGSIAAGPLHDWPGMPVMVADALIEIEDLAEKVLDGTKENEHAQS